jgi:hypothetical protein
LRARIWRVVPGAISASEVEIIFATGLCSCINQTSSPA